MSYTYPAVTTDVVALSKDAQGRLYVLLIRRGKQPFGGMWALPGGFVNIDELTEVAARRELHEETGLDLAVVPFHFLSFRDGVNRDPRGRVYGAVYVVPLVGMPQPAHGDDAAAAGWVCLDHLVLDDLAFDHGDVIRLALKWYEQRMG